MEKPLKRLDPNTRTFGQAVIGDSEVTFTKWPTKLFQCSECGEWVTGENLKTTKVTVTAPKFQEEYGPVAEALICSKCFWG